MNPYRMPDGVSPEQRRSWESFVRSNPSRVVCVLALGFRDQPNPWGDTLADFYPAMAAVDGAAIEKDQRWQNLVDVGVADVLCLNVISIKMKNYLQALPSGSDGTRKIPSSTFKPLNTLLHAALKFSSPPSVTDMKVIAALKKHWSIIVIRLLKEPENALKPGEPFNYERRLPAHLFARILLADRLFAGVLDNERDYTIQLIGRYWKYASGHGDIALNTSLLTDFVNGETDGIRAYKSSRSFNPSILIRVIQGANGVGNFISAVASHLDLYRGFDAFLEVSLLDSFWMMAVEETHPLHSEMVSTHSKSLQLWTSICSLLRRTANDKRPLDNVFTVEGHIGVIVPLTHHIACTVSHCATNASVKDCLDLIQCCVAADLFGTLDVIIPFFTSKPPIFSGEFLNVLVRVFHGIKLMLEREQTLAPILRSQFPRALSFRALVDLSRTANKAPPTTNPDDDMPPCWMLFRDIERACVLEDECTQRDCVKKRTARCTACKKVGYCSVHCQKRDWPEHKKVCKLEVHG